MVVGNDISSIDTATWGSGWGSAAQRGVQKFYGLQQWLPHQPNSACCRQARKKKLRLLRSGCESLEGHAVGAAGRATHVSRLLAYEMHVEAAPLSVASEYDGHGAVTTL